MILLEDMSIIGKFMGIRKTSSGKYILNLECKDEKVPIEITEDFANTSPNLNKGEVVSVLAKLVASKGKLSLVLNGLMYYERESTNN